MKILQVHNRYKFEGGEERVFDSTCDLLKRVGFSVSIFTRNSNEIGKSILSKLQVFMNGIYSWSSAREITRLIKKEKPDIVHIHNVYPLLSPSVVVASNRAGVPVVMTCHNYRLICPIGLMFHDGEICEKCTNNHEYQCIHNNCRNNIFESMAYTLRNVIARKIRLFINNVTLFIAPSEFAKQKLILAGIPTEKIKVLYNMVSIPQFFSDPSFGDYFAYVGRLSNEKGIDTFLSASRITGLPAKIVGDGPNISNFVKNAPSNVEFKGRLNRVQLDQFYNNARFIVLPSKWFEVFGLVAIEAMSRGLPVIASRIGGLAEIVDDGITGYLFESGNAEDLVDKIKLLWYNQNLCKKIGKIARNKAICEYSEEIYYKRLIYIYKKAIEKSY